MKIPINISSFIDVEAYNVSTLNYYVFCHGFDERHNREKRLWKDFSCRGDDQDPKEWRQKLNRERKKLKNIGEWKGQNNMGKILMICRDCLVVGKEPPIDYDLLRQSNIYLFGKLLTF